MSALREGLSMCLGCNCDQTHPCGPGDYLVGAGLCRYCAGRPEKIPIKQPQRAAGARKVAPMQGYARGLSSTTTD